MTLGRVGTEKLLSTGMENDQSIEKEEIHVNNQFYPLSQQITAEEEKREKEQRGHMHK